MTDDKTQPTPEPEEKPPLKERLKTLLSEYGPFAFVIYLTLFGLTLAGFYIAIVSGIEVDGTAGSAGTLAAAWVATKLTQPLRIAATLMLTPIVGKLVLRRRAKVADDESSASD